MNTPFTVVEQSFGPDEAWYCDAYKDAAGIVHITGFGRVIEQEGTHEQAGSSAARDSDTVVQRCR
jgi:hypothetical protein